MEEHMERKVNVGLLVPIASGGPLPSPRAYRDFFQEAERLGFHSLWVIDRIFHRINVLDALTVLSWAAAVTERVRLGTAVLLFALRSPVLMAKAVASLDHLSGGRVTLGISLGGRDTEYQGVGVPMKERVARLRENLTVMRRLLSEEKVTLHGRFQSMDDATVNPKPAQPGGVPILFGAAVDASLARVAELADGWIQGGGSTVEDFSAARQKIQAFAQAQGRDLTNFQWVKLIYTAAGADREKAREMLRPYLHAYYSPSFDIDRVCAFGTPGQCLEFLTPFARAGLQTFVLGPPSLDLGHLRRLAQEVVPRLA
jgi:probable F420-dependent oxidoreductase